MRCDVYGGSIHANRILHSHVWCDVHCGSINVSRTAQAVGFVCNTWTLQRKCVNVQTWQSQSRAGVCEQWCKYTAWTQVFPFCRDSHVWTQDLWWRSNTKTPRLASLYVRVRCAFVYLYHACQVETNSEAWTYTKCLGVVAPWGAIYVYFAKVMHFISHSEMQKKEVCWCAWAGCT